MKFEFDYEKPTTYTHYDGQAVDLYIITDNCRELFKKQGVDYINLPIDSKYDVLKLSKDGEPLGYAIIEETSLNDFHTLVYVMDEAPIDFNWDRVVQNTSIQDAGGTPMVMPSKFKAVLDGAEKKAKDKVGTLVASMKGSKLFAPMSQEEQDQLIENLTLEILLVYYWCTPERLESMPSHDIPEERKAHIIQLLKEKLRFL